MIALIILNLVSLFPSIKSKQEAFPYRHNHESMHLPLHYKNHPFERKLQTQAASYEDDETEEEEEDDYIEVISSYTIFQPIRITFDISNLEQKRIDIPDDQYQARIDRAEQVVLPAIKEYYESMLSVVPNDGLIDITKLQKNNTVHSCFIQPDGSSTITSTQRVYNETDILIYVTYEHELLGYQVCDPEGPNRNFASATICTVDQYDRPIIGIINFCLNAMKLLYDSKFHSKEYFDTNQALEVGIHEVGHLLGFNSEMYQYYRKPEHGNRLTDDQSLRVVPCVQGGKYAKDIVRPGCAVIEPLYDDLEKRHPQVIGYQIVTPTVVQVARNHFNCSSIMGVKLEQHPRNENDCFGSHWHERYFYSELFSQFFNYDSSISPLTLALFEDTGWYKANFQHANLSTFGLHAGCDFLEKPCLTKHNKIPKYSRGYFCNKPIIGFYDDDVYFRQCDPTSTVKAGCDAIENEEDETITSSYFNAADNCPIAVHQPVPCKDTEREKRYNEEVFGQSSRCFEMRNMNKNSTTATTPSQGERSRNEEDQRRKRKLDIETLYNKHDSICLHTTCNPTNKTYTVTVDGITQECKVDFQHLQFQLSQMDDDDAIPSTWEITCPRLSVICPQFFCPGLCSGRGKCIADTEFPHTSKCQCFEDENVEDDCQSESFFNISINNTCSNSFRAQAMFMSVFIWLCLGFTFVFEFG